MRVFAFTACLLLCTAAAHSQQKTETIDFRNFEYPWIERGWSNKLEWLPADLSTDVHLVNGCWRMKDEGQEDSVEGRFSGLQLESVQFADVTGDGKDEALVVLRFDTGGTQYYHYVYVFSLTDNRPSLLAYLRSGDRAASGLYRVYADRGQLVLEVYDPQKSSGDCCSTGFLRTRYRWRKNRFMRVGSTEVGSAEDQSRVPVDTFGNQVQSSECCN